MATKSILFQTKAHATSSFYENHSNTGMLALIMQQVIHRPLVAWLTLSLPESVMETFMVILIFESVVEILWCDHSNETSSAALSHGTICI